MTRLARLVVSLVNRNSTFVEDSVPSRTLLTVSCSMMQNDQKAVRIVHDLHGAMCPENGSGVGYVIFLAYF